MLSTNVLDHDVFFIAVVVAAVTFDLAGILAGSDGLFWLQGKVGGGEVTSVCTRHW